MIKKLALVSYKYRKTVVLCWVILFAAVVLWARSAGDAFSQDFNLPGTDSQSALNVLKERFPMEATGTGNVVFKAKAGVRNPAVERDINNLFTKLATVHQVIKAQSPYSVSGAAARPLFSPNGTIAYGILTFNKDVTGIDSSTITTIQNITAAANHRGLQIDLGGEVFSTFRPQLTSEGIGISAAIVILLISFGSLLAMGLPIVTALIGIGIGVSLIELLAHIVSLPDFSTQLGAMIGIGVGIDYALLIVTRYRQSLKEGLNAQQSIVRTINTAGRSVLFAGITVIISLLGMVLMNISFIQGLGLAAAVVVAVIMLASLTLLPAILGFVGKHIDALKIPGVGKQKKADEQLWVRWSKFLQKRPWQAVIVGLTILLVLAIPLFSMRLGSSDASNLPTSDTTRRAYDLFAQGFGVGSNGPLLLSAPLNTPQDTATLQKLATSVAHTIGVAYITPPQVNKQHNAAVLQVIPTTSPQDNRTVELIHTIRSQTIPEATKGTSLHVYIGGVTATFDDLAARLQDRLPIFIGAVLILSFVLLLLVFRSVLVPLKAVVMNLISIGAAYGVLVAVFQWGWLKGLVSVGQAGPIESFVPMMMFAILFGLSMDYEVFLLSRIKEEYDRSNNNAQAVSNGLSHTARVISAAAAIMVTVFGSFIVTDLRILKEFGLGLSVAILLDATIVRLILVPATMELLGNANWWFPHWLKRLPVIHIDGNEV